MEFSPQALLQRLHQLPDTTRWVVGLSGGVDSVALLHALYQLSLPEPVVAVHINHGLSTNAERWQQHCASLCRDWGIELVTRQVTVTNQGRGVEDAARQARYDEMAGLMEQGDMLLLAHHQDDQAETLLFRLMRGAGPYGLSAMDVCRPFAQGYIGRPLLKFSKRELQDYAESQQLIWVEDESNQSQDFDRNYLRSQVMPLLEARWPNFARRWQQTAESCQQADQLCLDLGLLDLARCDEQKERWGYSLCHASVALLPRYRRNNLLRNWARTRGCDIMEFKHLEEVDKQLFTAAASGAAVQWGQTSLRLYDDRLFLTGINPVDWSVGEPLAWTLATPLSLPDSSRLVAQPTSDGGLRRPAGAVEVRWRQGGERCQPSDRPHSQTLKKLLQEEGVEPWLRDRVPLIYIGGELAAVGDFWVCKGFRAEPGEAAVNLSWQIPN